MTVKFFIKASSVNSDKAVIRVRIVINREKAELSLPYQINTIDWSVEKQRTKKDKNINSELSQIETRLFDIKSDLVKGKKTVSAKLIAECFKGNKKTEATFYGFVLEYVDRAQKNNKLTHGTKQNYKKNLKYIDFFVKEKKLEKLTLKEFEYTHIKAFDLFLGNYVGHISRKSLEKSTINKIHAFLRSALKEAEREDLINKSPYGKFKLTHSSQESKREFLTIDEYKQIEDLDLSNQAIGVQEVRDMFLFACCTGLRHSDIVTLKMSELVEMDGKLHVKKEMKKTKERLLIPLLPQALRLLNKYENSERRAQGFVMPKFTNQKMNAYLKHIANLANIDKSISTHVARHTCASLLLSNKLPIEMVQRFLGQKDIKTTMIYARLVQKDFTDTVLEVGQKVFSKGGEEK